MEVTTFDKDSTMVITATHSYALMICYGINNGAHITCGTNIVERASSN